MRRHFGFVTALALVPAPAQAEIVRVDIAGTVEYNQFRNGPFFGVPSGAPASISFSLDSADFLNSPNFPTRGYAIDQASFVFAAGGASVGLASPFPPGQTPFFVIRDNDPAVDGFLISTNVDFPFGVPLPISGASLNYLSTLQDGSVLPSLDILDAVGTYDLSQMSSFDWSVSVGPGLPMGLILDTISITPVPTPGVGALVLVLGAMRPRRR